MKVNYQVLSFIIVLFITLSFTQSNATGSPADKKSGCLYMQTNGINNEIIYYARMDNGNLVEKQRITTVGAGSGTFKPITGHDGEPNAFEGVKSVILSSDHKWLFTTNGGNIFQRAK